MIWPFAWHRDLVGGNRVAYSYTAYADKERRRSEIIVASEMPNHPAPEDVSTKPRLQLGSAPRHISGPYRKG
jgi:hypothetical protein